MPLLDVLVPQMGEGLQEVVIVGFQKNPGDAVKRDELLYSMETDKAVMDVESPYEGILREWLTVEGAVLPIGTAVARIETGPTATLPNTVQDPGMVPTDPDVPDRNLPNAYHNVAPSAETLIPEGTASPAASTLVIPPRTRALCKQWNISEVEMRMIPASGNKLMPADVEAYVAARAKNDDAKEDGGKSAAPTAVLGSPTLPYVEKPLSAQQRVFTSRIRRSAALVIPATMTRPVMWQPVADCTRDHREQDFTFRPTEFQTLAWCVAQAARRYPKLRSTLQGDENVREYSHLNLGVAVGLKSGELVTAVVREAETLDYHDFIREIQASIGLAREGKDQADASTQLHLTYLGGLGITEGTPILVAPAIAVLFVGACYPRDGSAWANLTLTFDHRLINGVEGAEFLKSIVETIGKLHELA